MDLVSAIIPYFKKKNFIDQSISSVLNQSYSNIEIIIVYDDEEKSDLEYLRKIYNSNKKIKIKLENDYLTFNNNTLFNSMIAYY